MIITPRIDDSFTYRDLIAKLNSVATYNTYVYEPTWKDYKGTKEPRVSFVYMDGDNSYKGEDGLYGCSKTAQQQVEMLKKIPGDVRSINPVEYIMLFTMYRNKPLDRYTWTRFLDDAFRRGGYWGDGTDAGVFALRLTSAPSGAYTYYGFRVARGLTLSPSNLLPCSPSSSEADAPEVDGKVDRKDDELGVIARSLQEIVDREKKAEYDRGYEAGRASVKEELKGVLES